MSEATLPNGWDMWRNVCGECDSEELITAKCDGRCVLNEVKPEVRSHLEAVWNLPIHKVLIRNAGRLKHPVATPVEWYLRQPNEERYTRAVAYLARSFVRLERVTVKGFGFVRLEGGEKASREKPLYDTRLSNKPIPDDLDQFLYRVWYGHGSRCPMMHIYTVHEYIDDEWFLRDHKWVDPITLAVALIDTEIIRQEEE